MEFVFDEFVNARMAEALEENLRINEKFQSKQKRLHKIFNIWQKYFVGEEDKEKWLALNQLEEAMAEHTYLYGKEAYKLGYYDGIQVGEEHQLDGNRSILSQKDMTHLVYVYDAVKKLNEVMLGEWLTHFREDGGVFGALDRVYDVIEHSACSRIRLLGEEESYEVLIGILDDKSATPEERAKLLLGVSQK